MIDFLRLGFPVILPVMAILTVEVVFLRTLWKRDAEIQVFEIGIFFSSVVLLYTILPFLAFAANGWTFSPLGDARLFVAQPSPDEIAPIYWYHFLFLGSFVLVYAICRGHLRLGKFQVRGADRPTFWALVLCFLAIRFFFIFIKVYYKVEDAESYGESYLALKGLPLIVQQLANHLAGM